MIGRPVIRRGTIRVRRGAPGGQTIQTRTRTRARLIDNQDQNQGGSLGSLGVVTPARGRGNGLKKCWAGLSECTIYWEQPAKIKQKGKGLSPNNRLN